MNRLASPAQIHVLVSPKRDQAAASMCESSLTRSVCAPSTGELLGHGACALQLTRTRTARVCVLLSCLFILCLRFINFFLVIFFYLPAIKSAIFCISLAMWFLVGLGLKPGGESLVSLTCSCPAVGSELSLCCHLSPAP